MLVMTGGTRGLGRIAAEQITAGGIRVMGVRGDRAPPEGWQGLPLDLCSLASVRCFVAALPHEPVSHLILNAGGQRSDAAQRTEDGFETTFASNHLGHFLLLRLLMPRLAKGARIVITSSGTHDPRERTGVPPPRHADAMLLARPERDPEFDRIPAIAGMRAYSASKLCNLMTALTLARLPDAEIGNWTVLAYDPGLTPGTGLVRNQPWIVRTLVWPLLPLIVPFAKGMNKASDAGTALAALASDTIPPAQRVYAALRKGTLTWPDPSELARNSAAAFKLWRDSERYVGL